MRRRNSQKVRRRIFLCLPARRAALRPILLGALLAGLLRPAGAQPPAQPEILDAGYPRAFFFRSSEGMAARGMPYERWEKIFSPLDGIMGKALEEEVPGRSRLMPPHIGDTA